MHIAQLPDAIATTFDLQVAIDGTSFDGLVPVQEVRLFTQDESGHELLLSQGDRRWLVRASTPVQQLQLRDAVSSRAPLVIWPAHVGHGRTAIQVHRFRAGIWPGTDLILRVDDLVLDELRSRFRVGGTHLDIHRWLTEQLQLEDDTRGQPRLVLQTGGQEGATSFRVVGHRISLDVERRDAHYQVRRVVAAGAHQGATLQLVFARLVLIDASATSGMTEIAQQQLEQALLSGDSYLELWRSYQQLDEQMVQTQVTAFGVLAYDHVEPRDANLRFRLADAAQAAARERLAMPGLRVEATEHDTPAMISPETPARSSRREHVFIAPLRRLSHDGRFVEVDAPDDGSRPPPQGYLRLSARGDEVRLRRRRLAEERLRSGNLPLPHLGLLLEGKTPVGPRYARRTPSPKVLREAFSGTPTERQLSAIDIAINTPDIALIQGPPGTGKTQVITALQRCLAELGERDGERHHRILVTSTQHEAVDNVIARTSIFGVPAVKVGRRRQEAAAMDGVERWRQAQISRLQARSAVDSEPEKRLRARRLAVRCLLAPAGAEKLRQELSELERLVAGEVKPVLGERLRALIHRLATPFSSPDQERHELERRCAHGICLDPVAFTDDGPLRAGKALLRLDPWLTPEERAFLERCRDWDALEPPPWLTTEGPPLIEPLRERMSRRATTEGPVPGLTPTDGRLLRDLLDDMQDAYRHGPDRAQGVVADYLDDLTNDSAGLRRAIQHYTVVLAATCQQAASERMLSARELSDGAVNFETVIVDEAARSHPLDLFIPMTMAQRRIVLVGDHRQLPHMLEPDVERAFLEHHEPSLDAPRTNAEPPTSLEQPLRQSLFARLWAQLKQLEARDGIVRTVTLDTQFRMHPVLGRYVSEQFYEVGADQVKLTSVLPAERFGHSLGRYQRDGHPCCAAWLDVPASQGREHQGRSKSRPAEARQVAAAVRALLEESADLTVGVITFYAAQVELLFEELARRGVAERTDAGDWQVSDAFSRARDDQGLPIERVRVGTVDSFQGKEFDVVILSVVRSNDLPATDETQRRSKYGHLLLANRLCVAMSRQRRLLIVAGDWRFVRQATALPQLHAFQQLCEGPHGCIL